MLFTLLQTTTPDPGKIAQKFSPDTLASKGAEIMEVLRNTPPKELVEEMVSSFIKFGFKVLVALILYFIGAWLIRKFKNVIARAFTRRGADATLTSFIQSVVTAVLWILLIMVMIGTLGINTTSLAALLAAGGMAIGMAMSGTVQNFAGGLILLAFKPFKAGDYIEAQGNAGIVKEINIVSTKILTIDNREVIIPNGALSNGNINNFSAKALRRVDLKINLPYGSDAEEVRSALLGIVENDERILNAETPGAEDPSVVVSALNESSVEFFLRVWVKSQDYRPVLYWLNESIYTQLPKQGIHFPFPQLDIHLKHS